MARFLQREVLSVYLTCRARKFKKNFQDIFIATVLFSYNAAAFFMFQFYKSKKIMPMIKSG